MRAHAPQRRVASARHLTNARVLPADVSIGDDLEVACAFRNTGNEDYNISFIAGSLNNAQFFPDYVTNVRSAPPDLAWLRQAD